MSTDENKKIFCITFEDDDNLVGPGGAEQPYIYNDGVTVVTSALCPQGDKCGWFNNSRLEIPYFSNNYGFESIRITFQYKRTGAMPETQGIISNDCFNMVPNAAGNSLYCSSTNIGAADNDDIEAGLRSPPLPKAPAAFVSASEVSTQWTSSNV